MSEFGPLRHFMATQQFSRYRCEADIQRAALTDRIYEYAPSLRHGRAVEDGRKRPDVPAIHVFNCGQGVDGRNKSGHDEQMGQRRWKRL
jgi:hypothetical protein